MKLIIDIPDEVYKNPHNYCCYSLANEFKNGIPLEDIKAEIIEMQERNDRKAEKDKEIEQWLFHVNQGLEVALLIIDRHIGGEE